MAGWEPLHGAIAAKILCPDGASKVSEVNTTLEKRDANDFLVAGRWSLSLDERCGAEGWLTLCGSMRVR